MAWKTYKIMHTATVIAKKTDGSFTDAIIQQGKIYTGKQKVYVGFYTQVEVDELSIVEEHRGSLYRSFRDAITAVGIEGYGFNLFGLQNSYRESGMSENSGYGYVDNRQSPVLMIGQPEV